MKPRHVVSVATVALFSLALHAGAHACTLWGVAGSASAEGNLLVKNRDWRPDHQQSLRLLKPKHGIAYLGLYADDGKAPGIKAGVNQAGLSVISASASSLPRAARMENPELHGVIADILRSYHSIDEVAQNADAVFAHARPIFLLLADSRELMQVEVGQDGRFAVKRSAQGTLTHTNHYADAALLRQPQHIGESSRIRLERINSLLQEEGGHGPLTLAQLGRISQDKHDGPDDSLWRSGREYTLASWQIALPKANGSDAPHLHLMLANPAQPQQQLDWRLDAAFWQQAAQTLAAK